MMQINPAKAKLLQNDIEVMEHEDAFYTTDVESSIRYSTLRVDHGLSHEEAVVAMHLSLTSKECGKLRRTGISFTNLGRFIRKLSEMETSRDDFEFRLNLYLNIVTTKNDNYVIPDLLASDIALGKHARKFAETWRIGPFTPR